MRIHLLIAILASMALLLVSPVAAQDDSTTVYAPYSERYTLDVPTDWVSTQDGVRGLSGTFIGESLAIADSEAAMQSLQSNNPSLAIAGKTLVADVFPTATITRGQSFGSAEELFRTLLQQDADDAIFFEADGLAAARVDNYPGPPYGNNEFGGLTMILSDNLIYFMVYGGPDAAALDELATIAASLRVNPVAPDGRTAPETLGENRVFTAETLSVPLNNGWMVLSAGEPVPGLPSMYMILPETATLDYILVPSFDSAALPGMFIQVQVVPYDARFGTSDYTPTEDDLSFLMVETLGATGGEPELGAADDITIAGFPAQRLNVTNVFGAANRGSIILIDSGDTLYTITIVGPESEWDNLYLPLAEGVFANLSIETRDPNEVTVGLQVGQQAPDFTLTTLDGQTVTLSELRGKIVLLNFWATWCPPCRIEMPEFEDVANTRSDEIVIVAVNLMEGPELVQPFVDELGLTFTIAMDPNGDVNQRYQVTGYPTSYIIDAEGMVSIVHVGPTFAAQIDEWIELSQ